MREWSRKRASQVTLGAPTGKRREASGLSARAAFRYLFFHVYRKTIDESLFKTKTQELLGFSFECSLTLFVFFRKITENGHH